MTFWKYVAHVADVAALALLQRLRIVPVASTNAGAEDADKCLAFHFNRKEALELKMKLLALNLRLRRRNVIPVTFNAEL